MQKQDWFKLAIAVALLGAAGFQIRREWMDARIPPRRVSLPQSASDSARTDAMAIQMHMLDFVRKVGAAETIADPLQRCLAFPDPPLSHWKPATVSAYCRYQNQSAVTLQQARDLIASGHADQLDRRLADALGRQLSKAGSPGLLDSTYLEDFAWPAKDTRAMIEAWKRQSPHSAFALAASGAAFVEAAYDARGGEFADETKKAQFDAMEKLLALARTDLDKAIAIEPRMTPAYTALLVASRTDRTPAETFDLAEARAGRGSIESATLRTASRSGAAALGRLHRGHAEHQRARPGLGEGQPAAVAVAGRSDRRSIRLPLLQVPHRERTAIPANAVDGGATSEVLSDAGNGTMNEQDDPLQWDDDSLNASIIYLAEALRFDPQRVRDRLRLIDELLPMDPATAVVEGDRAVALSPRSADAFEDRARAKQENSDDKGAEQDYRTALSLRPGDVFDLYQLGWIFANSHRRWDEAWTIADQLVREHPDHPEGWTLRAQIQETQPRPGLHDTLEYLVSHFSDDPRAKDAVKKARATLAVDYAKSVGGSH